MGVAGCLLALRRLAVGHHGYAHWCRVMVRVDVDACTELKVRGMVMAMDVDLIGPGEVVT